MSRADSEPPATEQAYIEKKVDISPPQDKLEEMEHSIWDSMTKKAGPD